MTEGINKGSEKTTLTAKDLNFMSGECKKEIGVKHVPQFLKAFLQAIIS